MGAMLAMMTFFSPFLRIVSMVEKMQGRIAAMVAFAVEEFIVFSAMPFKTNAISFTPAPGGEEGDHASSLETWIELGLNSRMRKCVDYFASQQDAYLNSADCSPCEAECSNEKIEADIDPRIPARLIIYYGLCVEHLL